MTNGIKLICPDCGSENVERKKDEYGNEIVVCNYCSFVDEVESFTK